MAWATRLRARSRALHLALDHRPGVCEDVAALHRGRRRGCISRPTPNLPRQIERVIDIAFIVAFALQGAVWARELILGLLARKIEGTQDGGTLANATALIRVLVSFTVFALALVLILDNLGVNVTALVAGLGIGGIAIGLAAQGIFSDLFAALSIVFDKPFKRGDTIRYDNTHRNR